MKADMFESFHNEVEDHNNPSWLLDDFVDCEYTVSDKLLSGGLPVANKQAGVMVNDTMEGVATTLSDETYSLSLHLPPMDSKPTVYNIKAVFEGNDPSNATYYGYTPNGTQYAVSTTIYYGLKPSANSTVLTVEPQATDATTTKNKELVIFFLLASFLFPTL